MSAAIKKTEADLEALKGQQEGTDQQPNQEAPEGDKPPEGNEEQPKSNVVAFDPTKFSLVVDDDISIDAGAEVAREGDLPFKAFFTENFAKAIAGGHPSSYCPIAFIQHRSDAYQRRVNKPTKTVKHGDVRAKVSDQFKTWQGDDAGRKAVKLQFANRIGTEEGDKAAQAMGPGVRFWLVKA